MTNLLASGLMRHLIKPAVWNTFWYVYPCSVLELMSHVKILPSKPEVTSKLSFREYSIFFTQFKWPCSDRTFDLRFRVSHRATVASSLHVANNRLSMNLKKGNLILMSKRVKSKIESDWKYHLLYTVDTIGVSIFYGISFTICYRIEQYNRFLFTCSDQQRSDDKKKTQSNKLSTFCYE